MKNRLLSLATCALVAAASSPSFAGNWEKPQPKGQAPVSKSQYYIYNAAAGQFMVNGANWGTRVTLGDKGLLAELTDSVHTPLADAAYNKVALQGWTIMFKDKFDGQYDKNVQDVYMFVDNQTQVYTNMAAQGHNFWKFIPWGGGYRIKIADQDDTFGTSVAGYENAYVAYMPEVVEEGISAPIVYPFANLADITDESTLEWRFVTTDEYATFVAKKALYNKLNQAEEEGAETADAEAVYNNENATVEEYEAATTALQRKIFEAYAKDASYDNPVDLTDLAIQTPTPGNDGRTGWINTNNGGYFKTGKHSDWSNADDDIDVFGPNFVEYWVVNPNKLANDTVYQVIESLPYGMYRLTANAVAIQQAEPGVEVTGVSMFADGGAMTKAALWSQVNHVPHKYSIEFAVLEDQTTIGMMIENTNANHAAISNFKLEFLGASSNPLVSLLQIEISKAEAIEENYSLASEEQLNKIVEEAKALINDANTSDEDLKAKTAELSAMLSAVQREIEKYAWASEYIQTTLQSLEVKYAEDFPELSYTLSEYRSKIDDAIYERTLTVAEIDAIEATVAQIIKDGIKAEMTVGKEVTGLLTNPNFDGNRNGWTLNSGSIKNATFNACEAYGEKFDLSQTLTDMPNGRYKVTCQAFYRPRPSGTAWTDYVDQNSDADVRLFLYGNSLSKAVKHVFDDQQPDQIYSDDVQPAGEGGMWSPNSIYGISAYFAEGLYENELEFAVVDGTLTIGLRVEDPVIDAGNNWSAFDNFHLYYLGEQASDYAATIEALMNQVMEINASGNVEEGTVLTEKASGQIVDANLLGAAALAADATVDQCVAAINALSEAIAYAKESQRLTKQLLASYNEYFDRATAVVNPANMDYVDFLDLIYEIFDTDGVFESNELVQEYLDRLAPEFTQFAISGGIGKATEETPHDITVVLVNPDFFYNNGDSNYGWTNSPSVQAGVGEIYNGGAFDVNQKIVGLVPGFYRLSADAFYRLGSTENSTKFFYSDLYTDATIEGSEESFPMLYGASHHVALKNIAEGASETKKYDDDVNIGAWANPAAEQTPELYVPNSRTGCTYYFESGVYTSSVNFEVTEEMGDTITIGIKKISDRVNTEWTPFDNFKLAYIGENAPTAIENVAVGGAKAEVVEQKFYTIDGMELARPVKGINIVKSVLGDGTVKVTKVMVK
ncbi:MAG: hypothetical protein NC388_00620 [Clostridium sp.]|nr:hypothetical protein [Clostridium sp.]